MPDFKKLFRNDATTVTHSAGAQQVDDAQQEAIT
jgi:hypothetical protein